MQMQKAIVFEYYINMLKSIHKGFGEDYKKNKITKTSPCEYIYNIIHKYNLCFKRGTEISTNVTYLIKKLKEALDATMKTAPFSRKSQAKIIDGICEKSAKIAINHIKAYANKSTNHTEVFYGCNSEFESYKNGFEQNTPDEIIYESFGIEMYIRACEHVMGIREEIEERKVIDTEELKKEKETLYKKIGGLKEKKGILDKEIEERNRKKEEVIPLIETLKAEKEELEEKINEIKSKHGTLCEYLGREEEIEQKVEEYEEAKKQCELLKKKAGELESNLVKLELNIKTIEKDKEENQNVIKQIKNEKEEAQREMKELGEKTDKLLDDLGPLEAQYIDKLRIFKSIDAEDIRAFYQLSLFESENLDVCYELDISDIQEGVADKIFSGWSQEEDGKAFIAKLFLPDIMSNFIKWITCLFMEAKKVSSPMIKNDIREKYNAIHSELQNVYDREKFNNYVGMSVFWLACVEKVKYLLNGEMIKEMREKTNNLDYNKAEECLIVIVEVMIKGLWHPGYEKLRVSAHKSGLSDLLNVKKMNEEEMRGVLNLANDPEEVVGVRLESAKAYLENEEKVNVRDEIRKIFILPFIEIIKDAKEKNKEDKLIIAMVSAAFIKYLKEYEAYY